MALQFSVSPIKSEVAIVERINNTIEAIPRPIINIEPIAFPAENPDTGPASALGAAFEFAFEFDLAGGAFAGGAFDFEEADIISILILFLLFYDFALASIVFVTPTNGANFANGNIIGILPKKIINRTNANNNICPPIIKIKSDVEVSITHFSIPTIFV